jgi:hypothetical protein
MTDESKNFWTSLPGILTGMAAVVTSVTGLFIAINGGLPKSDAAGHTEEKPAVAALGPAPAPVVALDRAVRPAAASTVPGDIYILTAVIEDADGFTNVRAARSPKAEVVVVVKRDEQFRTYKQDAKWWQVKTRDGVVGFIHRSRIRFLDAPPASQGAMN